ncbi:MAG: YegS/Rv2252/BmrU family lipid kinase [Defluviitaleaceae bacterium]|nr:YegS/Rv2252/BmrU family lipid kinase [Defluviitaleaceae bacterium]
MNKTLKLIYNPYSGDRSFAAGLDGYIAAFQQAGFGVHPFRSAAPGDIYDHIGHMPHGHYDAIAVAGGDGTLNLAINALIDHGHDIPLAVIPAGTANDFAGFVKMPRDADGVAAALARGDILWTDVGRANDKYFINVCGAGLFTQVSHHIDPGLKTTLGKLAYYLKSLEEIPNFEPMSVRITNSDSVIHEDIFLFLSLNSAGTGGFEKLVPNASISDGLFDFVAFKACPILELGRLFIKVLKQGYLSDPNVLYFRDSYVKVELVSKNDKYDTCDIDGEQGPKLPITIRNIHKRLPIILP